MRILLLAVLLSGCGIPPLRVVRYSDHNLIIANPEIVDSFCSDTAGKWDDGTPKAKGAPVSGCYSSVPTAWLKEPPTARVVIHENRHADCDLHSDNVECGKDPEKEGYR